MSTSKQLAKYDRKVAIKKPETELDKIKLWYFQEDADLLAHDIPITLTKTQELRRERLELVWGLLIQHSQEKVLKLIKDQFNGIKDRMARRYVRDATELFGSITQIKKDVQRALMVAKREAIITEIKSDEVIETHKKQELIHKHLERIEKMQGLDNEDTLSLEEIVERLELPEVELSLDPAVLEINHEVIDEGKS